MKNSATIIPEVLAVAVLLDAVGLTGRDVCRTGRMSTRQRRLELLPRRSFLADTRTFPKKLCFLFFSFTGCHLSAKQQQVWLITSAASARVAAAEAMAWPCCNSGKKLDFFNRLATRLNRVSLSLSDGKTVDTHTHTYSSTHAHALSLSLPVSHTFSMEAVTSLLLSP